MLLETPTIIAARPAMTSIRPTISVGWWIALGATIVLVVLATLPPFVDPRLRSALLLAFSGACHQIPERSPHLLGVALAVCHRCYGAYLALPLAALVFRWAGRWDARLNQLAPILLTIGVIVPGVDWFGDVLGVWTNTPVSRMLTGAVFGLAAGYFLSRAMAYAFIGNRTGAKEEAGGYASAAKDTSG